MAASPGVTVERRRAVTLVRMQRDDNRLHPVALDALTEALDGVEADDTAGALVLTGAGKFFSNGLDLDHMAAHPEDAQRILGPVHALLGRVPSLPVPTVAAVNGHAFAAGAMLGGPDALASGIVSEIAAEDDVVERAVGRAEALAGKPRHGLAAIKRRLYGHVLESLGALPEVPA